MTGTAINPSTRTWSRAKNQLPTRIARFQVIDPLRVASKGVTFTALGVENVDGRQTYHLRSSYSPYPGTTRARLGVWFSTDRDYLVRYTRTTEAGKVVQRVDNRWLPRTAANLALVTATVPSGFRQASASP